MNALTLVVRPVVRWAALRAIVGRNRLRDRPDQGRFTRAEVRRMHSEAWGLLRELTLALPLEPTRGGRMNVLLACVTLAYFRALLAAGIERAYAIELLADAAWKIYEQWRRVPRVLGRFVTRDPIGRMRWRVDSFLRFPFNPPAYEFERLPTSDGIAVTMHRCRDRRLHVAVPRPRLITGRRPRVACGRATTCAKRRLPGDLRHLEVGMGGKSPTLARTYKSRGTPGQLSRRR